MSPDWGRGTSASVRVHWSPHSLTACKATRSARTRCRTAPLSHGRRDHDVDRHAHDPLAFGHLLRILERLHLRLERRERDQPIFGEQREERFVPERAQHVDPTGLGKARPLALAPRARYCSLGERSRTEQSPDLTGAQ
jgi:hypothetical protein